MFWQIFSSFEIWLRTTVTAQRGTDPTLKAATGASSATPNPGSTSFPIDGTPPQFRVTAGWLDYMISGMVRTINHATTSFSPYIAHAKAVTTARTGGIIAAFEAQLTGLAGDTSGATFAAFKGLAPTANGGSAVYTWGYVAAGFTRLLDLTQVATGEAIVRVKANLANALEASDGTLSYWKVVSTTAAERLRFGVVVAGTAPTVVPMADAAHALVYGTAGAGETKLLGNVVLVDPNSGQASEILTLPAVATSIGVPIMIINTGGEGIVVKDVAANTIITLDTAQHGLVVSDGTNWFGFMGGIT